MSAELWTLFIVYEGHFNDYTRSACSVLLVCFWRPQGLCRASIHTLCALIAVHCQLHSTLDSVAALLHPYMQMKHACVCQYVVLGSWTEWSGKVGVHMLAIHCQLHSTVDSGTVPLHSYIGMHLCANT